MKWTSCIASKRAIELILISISSLRVIYGNLLIVCDTTLRVLALYVGSDRFSGATDVTYTVRRAGAEVLGTISSGTGTNSSTGFLRIDQGDD
jgi:hypothetical protein